MQIKQAIKSRLNARQLALWHTWRAKMPDLVSRALSVLPVDQVVGIREGLQPEGWRDYPSQEIDVDGGEEHVVRGTEQVFSADALRTVLIEIDDKECPSDRIVPNVERTGLRFDRRHQRATPDVANYIFRRS